MIPPRWSLRAKWITKMDKVGRGEISSWSRLADTLDYKGITEDPTVDRGPFYFLTSSFPVCFMPLFEINCQQQ